jgi:hypothetical protein
VRAPSAAVFIAMDHGCAHTDKDKCEMLLKISRRFHDARLRFTHVITRESRGK